MTPKYPLLLLLAALTLLPGAAEARPRRLFVFAPSRSDARFQKQNALLAHSKAAFADRDLVRTDIIGADKGAASLRARYKVRGGSFRVLLIGRDGHVAYGGPSPVTLRSLTARIDAMPMRRDEMHRQGR